MLILLSGPIGSGKTTLGQRLVAETRECGVPVAGVLTPALIEDGRKIGISSIDLASGEQRLLACSDRILGGIQVGRYSFDDRTLQWMLECCQGALAGEGLVFVDEIGRLELNRGGGLAPLIPLLAQPRDGHTVVLVRESLLDRLVEQVRAVQPRIVVLDPARREDAHSTLSGLLCLDGPGHRDRQGVAGDALFRRGSAPAACGQDQCP